MFRDYKSGGYYLEGTALKYQRVMALILLIALAYVVLSCKGQLSCMKSVTEYIVRHKESKRKYPRRSSFGTGLDSQQWLTYLDK